jgi:predicted lipoprotein with Yx(FWY)xxD motif
MSASSRNRRIALVAVAVLVSAAALAALAFAKSTSTLGTAKVSSLGETIVVNSGGRTLYELSPETSHHLLCKSSQCISFWPPLKVTKNGKLSAGKGVTGKLGKLHRAGFYQVTLGGRPLYTFEEDKSKGQANGNGIKSFGGTWHVIKAEGSSKTPPATTTTTTTTSMPPSTTSPYGY